MYRGPWDRAETCPFSDADGRKLWREVRRCGRSVRCHVKARKKVMGRRSEEVRKRTVVLTPWVPTVERKGIYGEGITARPVGQVEPESN